jgi:predicted lipoprotein
MSNVTITASNTSYQGLTVSQWTSNNLPAIPSAQISFSCNTAVSASNQAFTNTGAGGVWASNQVPILQATAESACNLALYSSNNFAFVPTLTQFQTMSNVTITSSNTAYAALALSQCSSNNFSTVPTLTQYQTMSNVTITASNTAFQALTLSQYSSNNMPVLPTAQITFSSNTAVAASNKAFTPDDDSKAIWASNVAYSASNKAYNDDDSKSIWASNVAYAASNTSIWSSNNFNTVPTLTQYDTMSNVTITSSNTAYAALTLAQWDSNSFSNYATATQLNATSNYAFSLSNTGGASPSGFTLASNLTYTMSNVSVASACNYNTELAVNGTTLTQRIVIDKSMTPYVGNSDLVYTVPTMQLTASNYYDPTYRTAGVYQTPLYWITQDYNLGTGMSNINTGANCTNITIQNPGYYKWQALTKIDWTRSNNSSIANCYAIMYPEFASNCASSYYNTCDTSCNIMGQTCSMNGIVRVNNSNGLMRIWGKYSTITFSKLVLSGNIIIEKLANY